MFPELFHFNIAGKEIHLYTYGLMMIIGFLCAVQVAKWLANRSGLDGEQFVNLGLIGLLSGVIGARLSHILENWSEFTNPDRSVGANLWAMVNLSSGGLTYYGGFILAFVVLIIYARRKKIPLALGMDIVAPAIVIGLGFGRIGCFLNGCCHGAVCEAPIGVTFPYYSNAYIQQFKAGEGPLAEKVPQELKQFRNGHQRLIPPAEAKNNPSLQSLMNRQRSLPVHAAQLYSTITCFILGGLLLAYFMMPHAAGRVFALMLMLEGATRFILELLRVEDSVAGPFSLSMIIGLLLVALGIVLWFFFGRLGKKVIPAAISAPVPA